MLGSQSSSHSQPGAGPWEALAHLQPWALAPPWGQEWIMDPWQNKKGLQGAGDQHCHAEAGADSLSGLMYHPEPWAGQGE